MSVVDQSKNWAAGCRAGEQAQGGESNEEHVWPFARDKPEGRLERSTLRFGQFAEPRQIRLEKLMKARESERRL